MIAVNESMPIMPRFEMVNDPPWYSSGLSLPSRARPASSLACAEMVASPLRPASATIGVMRPVGVETATQMSWVEYLQKIENRVKSLKRKRKRFELSGPHCLMKSPCHPELASGTSWRARAEALTMKSLTESLTPALTPSFWAPATSADLAAVLKA